MRSLTLALILLLGTTDHSWGDVVTDWNDAALDAVRAERLNPPQATRVLAMMHVAGFEAMNAIRGRFRSYVGLEKAHGTASRAGAFAMAAHQILVAAFPSRSATFDELLATALAGITHRRREASAQLGIDAAGLCVEARADDGSVTVVPYVPSGLPGFWIPTPPAFAPALLPNWRTVRPWALARGDELRPPGAPALTSTDYATAFAEVASLGRRDSTVRTPEQTEIGLFWNDGAGTETPPGHWNDIAKTVTRHLTRIQRARVMALLNIALADAAIVAWDAKYTYDHWRPVTAIRAADTDGNPATEQDVAWTPLIPTPPFPAYISGHSTFSSTAATLLAYVLGTDDIPFAVGSDGLPGVTRTFAALSEAAAEAGQSRIYGGIHWQYDNQDGLRAGRALGAMVATSQLQPR